MHDWASSTLNRTIVLMNLASALSSSEVRKIYSKLMLGTIDSSVGQHIPCIETCSSALGYSHLKEDVKEGQGSHITVIVTLQQE